MGIVSLSGAAANGYAPMSRIPISKVAVGSIVYLKENGVYAPYLKVHQGIPSSLYDASCDGAWLLRKDAYERRQWNSSNVNDYEKSTINAYMNGEFYESLGPVGVIKQVKIPYRPGAGPKKTPINAGANGLLTRVFLLSAPEVGYTTANTSNNAPMDGAKLSYFTEGSGDDPKREAFIGKERILWWLRSPYCNPGRGKQDAFRVIETGAWLSDNCSSTATAIRPCVIIDNNATVDVSGGLIGG